MSADTLYFALTAWGTCALVVVTGVFMWKQVQIASRTAQVELFFKIRNEYNTGEVLSARQYYSRRQLPGCIANSADTYAETLLDFFETLGDLTKRKFLDQRMVWHEFSIPLRCYWPALLPYANDMKRNYSDNTLYTETESLYKLLLDLELEWNKNSTTLTKEACQRFFASECPGS